jgi:hypothetical protein
MADGPDLALQKALVSAMRAHTGLSALVGARVYDEPPQPVTFPYVRLGQMILDPLRMDGATDHDIGFSVEAHSQPGAGRVQAARIGGEVRAALNDAVLSVEGFTFNWCHYTTQSVTRNADGQSYVAVIAFEAALSDV